MQTVLSHIHTLGQRHAGLEFFDFLRDPSFAPQHRLAFLPAIAPYVVGLDDLHRRVLHHEPASDGMQRMVNDHVRAADHAKAVAKYWADLSTLGLLAPSGLCIPLERLDDEATAASRLLAMRLAHLGWLAGPAQRLALVACIEVADAALFNATAPLAAAHLSHTGAALHFCAGRGQLQTIGLARGWRHDHLAAVALHKEERCKALSLVDDAFRAYDQWSRALVRHAGLQATLLDMRSARQTQSAAGADAAWSEPATGGAGRCKALVLGT
jgi:hypothetical protein